MATRNLNYNVNARIKSDGLDELVRGLQKADKLTDKQIQDYDQLAKKQAELNKRVQAGTEGRIKNLRELNKLISGGRGLTSTRNAALQGQKNEMRARADNQFAELTNTVVRNMKQFTQAVGNAAVRELAQQRQRMQSGDTVGDLDKRIQAQEFRASQAAFGVSPKTGKALTGDAQRQSYAAEQRALDELRQSREGLVQQEKEQERIQRRRSSLQDQFTKKLREAQAARTRGAQRDRVAADIKAQELRLQKALIESGNERTQQVRRLESQLGRLKQTQENLVEAEKRETAEAREQQKLNERIARTTSRQNAQERAGRTVAAQDQTIAGYRQMIDSELKRTGGQRTDMVERLEQRLTKELQLRDQIQQEQKESTQLDRKKLRLQEQIEQAVRDENRAEAAGQEKERIGAQIKRKQLEIDQARLRTNNKITAEIKQQERELADLKKQQRKARIDEDRQFTQDRLFGDKGAGLFAIQAQLAGNFLVMDQLFNLVQFGTQFVLQLDQAFKQLQAITATTQTEMEGLRKELIKVSERTKFTAVDVAEAATTLGQAGFSTQQIKDSIESITLLATAVGSTLQQAVDLATSTIKVFNLQASEMGNVADTFTAAINNSKLTLDKLTLGIQYAGNIASQTGVKFQELTAALGAMANSGIRSGSMLGTGLRRLLIAFQSPKDKLLDRLRQLGLTAQDVNVEINGLAGVMRNLQDAGFGVSDAMDTMRIRAGSAFAALTNNIDAVGELRQIFTLTNAAAEANARQMEGLSNKLQRLKSIFGSFINSAGAPFIDMLKVAVDALAQMFQALNRIGPTLGMIGTGLATAFSLAIIGRVGMLLGNFLKLGTAARSAAAGMAAMATGATTLRGAITGLLSSTGIGLLLPLLGGLTASAISWSQSNDRAGDSLDRLQAKVDKTEGSLEKKGNTITSINDEIGRLINRSNQLEGEQTQLTTIALELQKRFGELGAQFDVSGGKVEDFIEELVRLRSEMRETQAAELDLLANRTQASALQQFQTAGQLGSLRSPEGTKLVETIQQNLGEAVSEAARGAALDAARQNVSDLSEATQGSPELTREMAKGMITRSGVPSQAEDTLLRAIERATSGESARGNEIAKGLGKTDALETRVEITDEMARLKDLQNSLTEREGRFNEISDNMAQQLQRVVDLLFNRLQRVKGLIAGAAADLTKKERAIFKSRVRSFTSMEPYKNQEEDVLALQKYLSDLQSQSKNAKEPQQQSALQDRIRTVQDRIEQIQQNLINKAMERMEIDEDMARRVVSNTGAFGTTNDLIGRTKEFYDAVDKTRAETIKRRGDAILQKLQNQQENIESQVDTSRTVEEIEALEGRLQANLAEQRKIKIQQELQKLRKQGDLNDRGSIDSVYGRVMEGNLTGFTDTGKIVIRNKLEETADAIDEEMRSTFGEVNDKISEASEPVEESLRRFSKEISNITSSLDKDKQANRRDLDRMKLKEQAAGSPEFQGQYSEVGRQALQTRIRKEETEALREDIKDINRAYDQLQAKQQEINTEIQARKMMIAEDRQLLGRRDVPVEEIDAAQDRIEEKQKDLQRLNRESLSLQQKLRQVEQDRVNTQDQLAARTGDLAAKQLTMGQTIRQAIRQYRRETGAMKDLTRVVGDNIKGVFQSMGSAFSQFVQDVASGNKSISESFRSMAMSVIESLMEIAAQQVAMRIFSGILSMVGGSWFGPSAADASTGMNVTNSGTGSVQMNAMRAGGSVKRAAAGTAVNTRDSVPILAQPGEYVLRKSAVDAIGRENLESINRAGNSTISRSAPKMQMPKQQGGGTVNVYAVAPEEKPQPGPNDVVTWISEDIQKGGTTKKMIRSVNMGE